MQSGTAWPKGQAVSVGHTLEHDLPFGTSRGTHPCRVTAGEHGRCIDTPTVAAVDFLLLLTGER